MLPPSLHAALFAGELRKSARGKNHLALDVSHVAVFNAAAAVLPRLPELDSLVLTTEETAISLSGTPKKSLHLTAGPLIHELPH
jgi:hypothetical protein